MKEEWLRQLKSLCFIKSLLLRCARKMILFMCFMRHRSSVFIVKVKRKPDRGFPYLNMYERFLVSKMELETTTTV